MNEGMVKKYIFILPFIFISCLISHAPTIIKQHEIYYYPLPYLKILQLRDAEYLKSTLNKMVNIPDYQRKGKQTFCNVGARDVLDNREHSYWGNTYGFWIDDLQLDISIIFPTSFSILRISIKEAYNIVVRAISQKRIESVSCEQAFYLAQKGEVIWVISAKRNHEAIVFPKEGIYDTDKGCMIAQCGYYNTIDWISDEKCFGKRWKDKEILYIHFKRRMK